MGTIRLKVKVLPWQNPSFGPRNALSRQDDIKTWIEPCSEDLTVSALHERILESFADLHGGKGDLHIKWLEDDDANVLRGHLRIGDTFKESRDISDRTVKVVRLPPTENDLGNPGRYSSIAPDSSARPFKRPLGLHAQNVRNSLRDIVNAEDWSVRAPQDRHERASKRQRTDDAGLREAYHYDRPLLSSEGREEEIYHSSSQPGRRGSPVHQVDDSQRSPRRKQRNPYGTPTSLSVYSPLNAIPSSQNGVITVPDSPERRNTLHDDEHIVDQYGIYKAKSESPELAPPVHEYPSSTVPSGPQDAASDVQAVEDAITSSLTELDPQRPLAPIGSDQRPIVPSSSELEERTVPYEVLRRSPFLNQSSRAVRNEAPRLESPRQRPSVLDDGFATRERSPQLRQMQEGTEHSLSPGLPLKAPVSTLAVLPLQTCEPTDVDNFGESLIPGIQKELLIGPTTIVEDLNQVQAFSDEQASIAQTPARNATKGLSIADQSSHQATPNTPDEAHFSTGPSNSDPTAALNKASEHGRVQFPDHETPESSDRAPDMVDELVQTNAAEVIEPPLDSTDATMDHAMEEAHEIAQMPPPNRIRRRGEYSLHEALAKNMRPGSSTESRIGSPARKVAEIINIEETEDESTGAPRKSTGRISPHKPDVWTIPSDTDDSVVVKRRKKSTDSPNHVKDERVAMGKKVRQFNAREKKKKKKHESTEDSDEQHVDLDSEAERRKHDRESKDRRNVQRRELAAQKKAQDTNFAAQLEADDVKELEDRKVKLALEANVKQRKAEPKIAKNGREPSVHSTEKRIELERVAEKPISEREKKEREKIKKQEAAARRLEAKWAEEQKVEDAKVPKEQERVGANREVTTTQKATEANTARRAKTPGTSSRKDQEVQKIGTSNPAKSESKASVSKKARGPADVAPKEEVQKGRNLQKRTAPGVEASEDRKAKMAKSAAEEEAERSKRTQRQATAEADIAAREADAIARLQKSIKSPSSKSMTRKTPKAVLEAGPGNELVQKARESSEASKTSGAPSKRNDALPKRRSMTPLFPTSITRQPVKSSLRTSEISNRRSVSFNDEAIALESLTMAAAKNSKLPAKTNARGAAQSAQKSGGSLAREPISSPSERASKGHQSEGASEAQSQKLSTSKSTTPLSDASLKPKKQTKLNVIRDVKMKGRAGDPPVAKKPVTPSKSDKIEIISSDSEKSVSTFYSDEEDRPRPAKAGPSSKKKLSNTMKSDEEATARKATPTARETTGMSRSRLLDGANGNTESPATASAGSGEGERRFSMSRSPAQYISRADSASSRSGSRTDSQTASGSESASGSGSESGPESETDSEDDAQASGHRAPGHRAPDMTGRTVNGNVQSQEDRGRSVPQSSKSPQSRSASPEGSNASEESEADEEEEDLGHQMEQQLQRDCRQSMEPQSQSQPALPRAKPKARKVASSQPLAAEYPKARFPSLSGLKNRSPKDTSMTSTSKAPETVTKSNSSKDQMAHRGSVSSSESDEDSSSSEDSVDGPMRSLSGGKVGKAPPSLNGIQRILKLRKRLPSQHNTV